MKICRVCKKEFNPIRPLQAVCTPRCAVRELKVKKNAQKADLRARKEKLKSRSDHLREAQAIFNKYIRIRDKGLACISCGRNTGSKVNAGHYLAVGSHPELRFNEENVHLQCEHCNTYLSGNQLAYRLALIDRIGIDRVEWLEGKHEPVKYTVDEIQHIKQTYKNKLKDLEK